MTSVEIDPFEWSDVPHELFTEVRATCPVAKS